MSHLLGKGYIYTLSDPRDNKVRYIGRSSRKDERTRLMEHIASSKVRKNHKSNWIRKLLSEGVEPIIKVILRMDNDLLGNAEKEMIIHYSQFCKLTNGTKSGDGGWVTYKAPKIYKPLARYVKKIYQYDKNGILIQEWASIRGAADYFNVCDSTITRAAQGGTKCSGFNWKYEKDAKDNFNNSLLTSIKELIKF